MCIWTPLFTPDSSTAVQAARAPPAPPVLWVRNGRLLPGPGWGREEGEGDEEEEEAPSSTESLSPHQGVRTSPWLNWDFSASRA